MALKLDFNLDNETYRHYLNGHPVVMHSHHYPAYICRQTKGIEVGDPYGEFVVSKKLP